MVLHSKKRRLLITWPHIILIVICSCSSNVYGQAPEFEVQFFEQTSPLATGTIYAIEQDIDGFLWFASEQKGLCRYDGTQTVHFTVAENDNSVSDNRIRDLALNATGTELWIATYNKGIDRLDLKTGIFTNFIKDEVSGISLQSTTVWTIFLDSDDFLWIGTYGEGLFKLNTKTGSLAQFKHNPDDLTSLINNQITSITKDKTGNLWLATTAGLTQFNKADNSFIHYTELLAETNSFPAPHQVTLAVATSDSLVSFGYKSKVGWINYLTGEKNTHQIKSAGNISGIAETEGGVWIGSDHRLEFYDVYEHILYPVALDSGQPWQYRVRSLFIDNAERVWVGTEGFGVIRVLRKLPESETIYSSKNTPSLAGGEIRATLQDNTGNLWLGTINGGLSNISITNQPENWPSGFAKGRDVSALWQDDDGLIWIGYWGQGIDTMHIDRGILGSINSTQNGLSDEQIQVIHRDSRGWLWVGTQGGLNRYDESSNHWITYMADEDDENVICGNRIQSKAFIEDSAGRLWIGTHDGGVCLYAPSADRFHSFALTTDSSSRIPVISLSLNEVKNELWVGTDGQGLYRINLSNNTSKRVSFEEGITQGSIYSVQADTLGRIWMTTSTGLAIYDSHTNSTFKPFISTQISDWTYFWGAALALKDGNFLFGGSNGATIINPNTYILQHSPNVRLTEFWKPSLGEHSERFLPAEAEIYIGRRDYVAHLKFGISDVSINKDNIKYRYKFEGNNDNWINLGFQNEIFLSDLDQGSHNLIVSSLIPESTWSEGNKIATLHVLPAFWESRLNILLLIFASLLILGYAAITYKEQQQKRQIRLKRQLEKRSEIARSLKIAKEKAEETQKLQAAFLANMSHEIRTPLTSILGFSSILVEELPDEYSEFAKLIEKSGTRLMSTLNSVLDLSMLQAGKMKADLVKTNVIEEVKIQANILRLLAEKNGLQLLVVTPNIPVFALLDQAGFMRILTNLIGNSIKFTETGEIKVTISKWSEIIRIEISDSGLGIHPDFLPLIFDAFQQESSGFSRHFEGNGLGLTITHKLVTMQNGTISAASKLGQGTTFTLQFPIYQDFKSEINTAFSEEKHIA